MDELYNIESLPDSGTLEFRKSIAGGPHIIVQLPYTGEGEPPYVSLWPSGRGRVGSAMHNIRHFTLRRDKRVGRGSAMEFVLEPKEG